MIVAAIVGGYVVTSVLLLKYPLLIRKKKEIKFRATHISHRGGAGENLENTMAAFKHAVSVGTEMLELDCHLTKDGEVVVSHDQDLMRTTGQERTILDTLFKDLPPLRESLSLDFKKSHRTLGGEDRSIPTLREVYQEFPELPINVDIKINNDDLIRKVSALTSEFKREGITVWGSRSSVVTNKCYHENPNMPILFSMKRVFHLILLFYTGLLPFVPLRESFYEVLMPSIIFKMDISGKQRILLRLVDCLLMNRALIHHLTSRGIQCYFWVLNDDDEFERAFQYGASGVMTDFPTKLSKFLNERPQLWVKLPA